MSRPGTSYNNQQTLFRTAAAPALDRGAAARQKAAKGLLKDLYKLRASLDELQREEYGGELEELIGMVKVRAMLTESKREELVLFAVEQSGACTPTEIAGDTRLNLAAVKRIVADLMERGILYEVPRYVVASDRKWTMIKSARTAAREVVRGEFSPFTQTLTDRIADFDAAA